MFKTQSKIDWLLLIFASPILLAGLITMYSFSGDNALFGQQLIWIGLSFSVFLLFSHLETNFLKRANILLILYLINVSLLIFLAFFGEAVQGSARWIDFGVFSFQPSDTIKIILILILAKYFSRRHIEIANIKHILISSVYALIPFILIFLQPDLGSAIVIFLIWLGMILVSGISKKHLLAIFLIGVGLFSLAWFSVLQDYQKERILTYADPFADTQGTGYNALQSTIAVGSGQLFGKGLGFGTQSRMQFLPEHETDFIFASFAEEWGFVGVLMLLTFFALFFWRILKSSMLGAGNFEMLFGVGLSVWLMSHLAINIGMNTGLLPVAGLTLPLMSYGGSHLLSTFLALGVFMSMRQFGRVAHREDVTNEFLGYDN